MQCNATQVRSFFFSRPVRWEGFFFFFSFPEDFRVSWFLFSGTILFLVKGNCLKRKGNGARRVRVCVCVCYLHEFSRGAERLDSLLPFFSLYTYTAASIVCFAPFLLYISWYGDMCDTVICFWTRKGKRTNFILSLWQSRFLSGFIIYMYMLFLSFSRSLFDILLFLKNLHIPNLKLLVNYRLTMLAFENGVMSFDLRGESIPCILKVWKLL